LFVSLRGGMQRCVRDAPCVASSRSAGAAAAAPALCCSVSGYGDACLSPGLICLRLSPWVRRRRVGVGQGEARLAVSELCAAAAAERRQHHAARAGG